MTDPANIPRFEPRRGRVRRRATGKQASTCTAAQSCGSRRTPACMDTNTTPTTGEKSTHLATGRLEPLLSIETLAEYVGVPVVTIYRWRTEGKGPCAVRIGRHLKFALSDVQAWLETVRETHPGTTPGGR